MERQLKTRIVLGFIAVTVIAAALAPPASGNVTSLVAFLLVLGLILASDVLRRYARDQLLYRRDRTEEP